MDYHFYFKEGSSSPASDTAELQTDTITVTEQDSSIEWKTDRIAPDELAWQVDAFQSKDDGSLSPVAVEISSTQSDTTTCFLVRWTKVFNGFINISTWKK